ncbi:BA75_02584T0 [Komagataella pastoris]|uniref:BA75_02584T0 n=1 Tax=Komagataella pastoris TaxID=4922 RepID=A0A1B2JBH5_PICPA|nr:BA75_02584T0 [Komagataella pastoris]
MQETYFSQGVFMFNRIINQNLKRNGTIWVRRLSGHPKAKVRSFRGHKVGFVVVGLAGGLYFANDTFRNGANHLLLTGERVGVVTLATMKCFKYYSTVLTKNFDSKEEYYKELDETHKRAALVTLDALRTNGGIYIKLGQHVSAMTYLLPKEWTETMIPLQDECPQSSLTDIKVMFEKDTGEKFDEVFSSIDEVPIGVASLAQVHIGTLRDSQEKVAIKFQHPSLQEFVPLDILMTKTVFDLMAKVFPDYPLTWLSDELQSSIYVELDFQNEAKNAIKTAEYFKKFQKQTALRIPKVIEAHKRVLILEYVPGGRLDDLKFIDSHNISRSEVSSCLSHTFNNMIFTPDVSLHCDPHGGNLAIRPLDHKKNGHNFEIILYDHGLYRDIPLQMKRDYAHFWLAMLDNDTAKMKVYAKRVAGITDKQFPLFAAAITGRDIDHALSGKVHTQREDSEIDKMHQALLSEGLVYDLMGLLSQIPRIVLLILKTNDLTRFLDEALQNPLGLQRTFLILASYCAKTVYYEEKEDAQKLRGLSWLRSTISLNFAYYKRVSQLWIYDLLVLVRGHI